MKHQRIKYLHAFVIMVFFALFRVLLILFSYWSILQMNANVDPALRTPPSIAFQFSSIFPCIVLFAEATCYLVFRNRFFFRRFVRFHLWLTFVSSFIFPILQFAGYTIIPMLYSSGEIKDAFYDFNRWGMISGWFLFGVARLFFIITMAKSVTHLNEQQPTIESTGYLDEFSNTN